MLLIESTLYSFSGGTDGQTPLADLTLSNGVLYGTSSAGGSDGDGTIFSVNTNGTGYAVLHTFTGGTTDGATPYSGLVLNDGVLYGTTSGGGADNDGTIFSINTDGTGFNVLYSFTGGSDGSAPAADLILSGSTLYGTTSEGGPDEDGAIFSIGTSGSNFDVLHTFTGTTNDGANPLGALTLDNGVLYGSTESGGADGLGTVFSINASGSGFQLLYSFDDGAFPVGNLTLVGSTLYGTTSFGFGNSDSGGTVFSINTSGTGFSTLHEFTVDYPYAGLTLDDGLLYGTTSEGGTDSDGSVFSINPSNNAYQLVYSFTGGSDGANPLAALTVGSGFLYGTASNWPIYTSPVPNGNGTIFSISTTAPGVTGAVTGENNQSTTGLVITPDPANQGIVNSFQITNITGGTLYLNDGVTPVTNGEFITTAEGAAGLKFTPTTGSTANGSFTVQESSGGVPGLLGVPTTATIFVVGLKGPPNVTSATTAEDTQSTSGLVITPNAADAFSVITYQITNITGGSLFLNDGVTPVTNGEFITTAQAAAGLKFTPTTGSFLSGSFKVQESATFDASGLNGFESPRPRST